MGQFGIGLLGRGWTREQWIDDLKAKTDPPRMAFKDGDASERYAAKYAAETILAEPPRAPVRTVGDVVQVCGVRPSEAPLVLAAFHQIYATEISRITREEEPRGERQS